MESRRRDKKRSRRSSDRAEGDGQEASPAHPEVHEAPQAEEPPAEADVQQPKSRSRRRSEPAPPAPASSDEDMAPAEAEAAAEAAAAPERAPDLADSSSESQGKGSDGGEEESGDEEKKSASEAASSSDDEESGSEAKEEAESEDDDEEPSSDEDGGNKRRSSRRRRETPGRPRRRSERLTRGAAAAGRYAESDGDGEDGGWGVAQPGRRFASRYSSRNRRQVDRLDPLTGRDGGGGGGGEGSRASKRARREESRATAFGSDAPTDMSSGGEESESEDVGSELEQEEGLRRKKYEFRDREAAARGGNGGPGGAGAGAAATEGAARRRRFTARRRGARAGGEVDELPLPRGGGGAGPLALGPASAPWAAALAAIGLGPDTAGDGAAAMTPGAGAHPAIAAAGASRAPGASAASLEINPLEVDPSVSFDSVGGLGQYVRALKEMIWLPLVYPELFERFQVTPPRGVLFYGPPGTGKTLVARALAAHASRAAGAGRKVSFFMRKGADLLNKYVGESERMLRMLFEEARRRAPSIIFFDEIDGLAPVRSSRSDQIHNSIVSTLLALMDGLDPRGQVVIIGATNRVDALDGALRRPGRFDRELLFPLPSQSARREILGIHTRAWAEPPPPELLDALAAAAVGYCGADLKALCTEASLAALRRRYPQIYDSEHKLAIDPGEVRVRRRDFLAALEAVTPASHRAAAAPGRPLPSSVGPALLGHFQAALGQVHRVFPPAAGCLRDGAATGGGGRAAPRGAALGGLAALCVQRPRLLVAGAPGGGQAHLGPALLYALEGLQAHAIGLPSLLADAGARSPEEALVHAVAEARRAAPAILYLPHLQAWWAAAPPSLRATLRALLADLPPDLPLLLLATADAAPGDLDPDALALFGGAAAEGVYTLPWPTHGQRAKLFGTVATALVAPEVAGGAGGGEGDAPEAEPEPLPRAPEAAAAEEAAAAAAAAHAARRRYEEDQAALRALRMALRWVVDRLFQARRWEAFFEPVDPADDPQYYGLVPEPMDLATLLSRVDGRRYGTPAQFLADVALIPAAERSYWRDLSEGVRHISRACALEDEARALTEAAVPGELRARVEAITAAGGPAPPPPGLDAAMGLAAAQGQTAAEAGGEGGAGAEAAEAAEEAQRATRRAGADIDRRIVHVDPEAQARRIKALKRTSSAAAAAAPGGDEAAPAPAAAPAPQVLAPLENVVAVGGKAGERDAAEPAARQVQTVAKPAAATAPPPPAEPALSPPQREQVAALQAALAERTGGLSLESLEHVNAQLGRLAWERQGEGDRRAVAHAALRTADELTARLKP